jgi:hypothetical protein
MLRIRSWSQSAMPDQMWKQESLCKKQNPCSIHRIDCKYWQILVQTSSRLGIIRWRGKEVRMCCSIKIWISENIWNIYWTKRRIIMNLKSRIWLGRWAMSSCTCQHHKNRCLSNLSYSILQETILIVLTIESFYYISILCWYLR